MSSPIRLITFDLDDTLWDVRPALEAAEAAQWSYLNARFPSLALGATPPEQIANLRRSLLEDKPELMHHISLFRQSFIERLCSTMASPVAKPNRRRVRPLRLSSPSAIRSCSMPMPIRC